jgi:hypothetical protein
MEIGDDRRAVQIAFQLRFVALVLVIGIIVLLVYAPPSLLDIFHTLLGLGSLALLLSAVGTLAWFFYWFFLRRWLRARRIAHARFQRIMREREQMSDHRD